MQLNYACESVHESTEINKESLSPKVYLQTKSDRYHETSLPSKTTGIQQSKNLLYTTPEPCLVNMSDDRSVVSSARTNSTRHTRDTQQHSPRAKLQITPRLKEDGGSKTEDLLYRWGIHVDGQGSVVSNVFHF